ncbi:adenosylcobinamide-phosphate synthase CbiB [Bradyrhizobium sp. Ash2021]|uniref:adenosylcobinamide-phosphate synthase CbiB n=1 Tax=Bradyrhizobium sp. Ash2021 TaxID=2954771 RepID=UPI00281532FE|nr:adenosylcobinamide-phosphate synthase CbiB [Bradyrhizobium sp. Ash2021]WMT78095.1 adenosylcobinamide-phosphate synthase CbiB [Bradyrhizobium sp. Ash2021]
MFTELALTALAIEAAFGFPDVLYRRIGHPVGWIGVLIAWCDRAWNRREFSFERRRMLGVGTLLLLLAVSGFSATVIFLLAQHFLAGFATTLVCGAVASPLLAQRSLDAHVLAVADALEQEGIEAGRRAVSMIVGRDTAALDEAGVSRAAIESLAENFSDGVVTPLFWLLVAGLPGVFSYKAINTADSMIGHKSDRYLAFGWASARVDDLVNLPASRLSALWLVLAAAALSGLSSRGAIATVRRDADGHRSPNAGWPEAAVAGALGLRLAGPRAYDGAMADDHWIGDGRETACAGDIRLALRQYRAACVIQFACVAGLAAAMTLL